MGADRLPAVPFSIFSITAKYGFVKPPGGAVLIFDLRRTCNKLGTNLGLTWNLRGFCSKVLESGVEHDDTVGEVGVGNAHPNGLSDGETGEGRSVRQV